MSDESSHRRQFLNGWLYGNDAPWLCVVRNPHVVYWGSFPRRVCSAQALVLLPHKILLDGEANHLQSLWFRSWYPDGRETKTKWGRTNPSPSRYLDTFQKIFLKKKIFPPRCFNSTHAQGVSQWKGCCRGFKSELLWRTDYIFPWT